MKKLIYFCLALMLVAAPAASYTQGANQDNLQSLLNQVMQLQQLRDSVAPRAVALFKYLS